MKKIILDNPTEGVGEPSEQGENSRSLKKLKCNYFLRNNGNYMYLVCTIINNFELKNVVKNKYSIVFINHILLHNSFRLHLALFM